jgi:hypothetical protein
MCWFTMLLDCNSFCAAIDKAWDVSCSMGDLVFLYFIDQFYCELVGDTEGYEENKFII